MYRLDKTEERIYLTYIWEALLGPAAGRRKARRAVIKLGRTKAGRRILTKLAKLTIQAH